MLQALKMQSRSEYWTSQVWIHSKSRIFCVQFGNHTVVLITLNPPLSRSPDTDPLGTWSPVGCPYEAAKISTFTKRLIPYKWVNVNKTHFLIPTSNIVYVYFFV